MFIENEALVESIREELEKDKRLIIRTFNLIAEALRESRDIKVNPDLDQYLKFLNKILLRRNYDLNEIEEFLMESDLHKGINVFSKEGIRIDLSKYQSGRKDYLEFPANDAGAIKIALIDR